MNIINFNDVQKLNISPLECYKWVREGFLMKNEILLPEKISLKLENNIFFNFMPCYIPKLDKVGVKIVSRFPEHTPSLKAQLMLFEASTGKELALMDATWITAMRTGAVATLAINTLQRSDAEHYSFIGLGNTSAATLLTLLSSSDRKLKVKLLKYKNQADLFIERFSKFDKVTFTVTDSMEELFSTADVIISGVSFSDELLGQDAWFKEGVLVVPIHTRGFQNCDLFFDKVFSDDRDHVKSFKYFNRFKYFDELPNILNGKSKGRESDKERILSYNIGIALHDIYYASKIYERIVPKKQENKLLSDLSKFWV